MYCDNQATISLTRDFQFHAKSKHIDIHVHLIRDKVSDGTVLVSYVPSEENVADIFTKGLPRIKHEKFVCEKGVWGNGARRPMTVSMRADAGEGENERMVREQWGAVYCPYILLRHPRPAFAELDHALDASALSE